MTDLILKAVDEVKEDNEDVVASAKDQEEDKDILEEFEDEDKDIIKVFEETEIELDLRDIHASMSQEVKDTLAKKKMIPDKGWKKTLNSSDMGEQLEMLSKQIEEISHDDNPLDKENSAQEGTIEKFTRSCSYCNNKFHWMAELIKHVLTDHKTIEAGETDPMWYRWENF